ncbi:rnf128 [Symbiodinium natans]|uniref:Rnf128 protein n=1 Tax=Symbiodinium natans TaxID=878477 RepID=A0A812KL10_9DINO|nr:rnf128 [Symbiodinium natans]
MAQRSPLPDTAPISDVVFFTALFNIVCNQQNRHGSLGARIFCGWSFDPENPERMPARVQLYNMIVPIFTAIWNMVGLYWVGRARRHMHEHDEPSAGKNSTLPAVDADASDLPRCKEVASGLVAAIHAYASFNLLYSFFILIGVAGLSQILFWLARRGLIRMNDAAPPGSLERNTEVVTLDDPAFVEQTQCSICLEDFAAGDVLVKTTRAEGFRKLFGAEYRTREGPFVGGEKPGPGSSAAMSFTRSARERRWMIPDALLDGLDSRPASYLYQYQVPRLVGEILSAKFEDDRSCPTCRPEDELDARVQPLLPPSPSADSCDPSLQARFSACRPAAC